MSTITINGKTYETETLSDIAKQHIASIRFVDTEIDRLRQQLAVLQTARNAYVSVLVDNVEQHVAEPAASPKKTGRTRSKKA